ncbi:MAG: BMP family ABC transporter substrate-binding protein [Anaerolineae bacterium]|nr:BMP family ABC transporter substrate-binding protein [Anaerolineae bacterium]
MNRHFVIPLALLLMVWGLLPACGGSAPAVAPKSALQVGVVLGVGGENDKSFNEYTLKGARQAAEQAGLAFEYVVTDSIDDYERNVMNMAGKADLVITPGYLFTEVTAKAARDHPHVHFVIVDVPYFPGQGCPETVEDCYSAEGGLTNVTSLVFAEDQMGYLAGVLAACMSQTGVIASVSGMEIPPVARLVTGYRQGAKSVNREIVVLNQYVPNFDDLPTGKLVGQDFINQGADVIAGFGGNTGNGGLLAAYEAGIMAIGVDVDQYFTYPEVRSVLLTSTAKFVDVAVADVVIQFAKGELAAGIQSKTLATGGVGLTPYHAWQEKIIAAGCAEKVEAAMTAIRADPTVTGVK